MVEPIATKQVLGKAQKGFRRDVRLEFQRTAASIRQTIMRAANANGVIPISRKEAVVREAGGILQRMFIGYNGQPFADDGVTATAPYPQLLNKWYVLTVTGVVKQHHNWMKRHIPEDVFNALRWRRSRPIPVKVAEAANPFLRHEGESVEDHIKRLADLRIFRPNPLAEYDPMHTWVDPNGYRLSDRIWNTSDTARNQLNNLIRDAINQGMPAEKLAKLIEQFLDPERAALRTQKPYGRDGSFDAMRLARTEISRAHAQAAFIAAYLNPYTKGVDWALSPSHPKRDVCDSRATIGMGGERLKDSYPFESAQLPPAHPHCLCRVQSDMRDDPATVTAQLKAILDDAQAQYLEPYLTPAAIDEFILSLLGPILNQFLGQLAA